MKRDRKLNYRMTRLDNSDLTVHVVRKDKNKTETTLHLKKIPNDITELGDGSCFGLNMVTAVIPSQINSMGMSCFENCKLLNTVVFNNYSIREFNNSLFKDCINLTTISIPKGVRKILPLAFTRCKSLTSITIPKNCLCWNRSFEDCVSLKEVTFENGDLLKDMKFDVFVGCNKLTKINVGGVTYNIPKGYFKNRYQKNPKITLFDVLLSFSL